MKRVALGLVSTKKLMLLERINVLKNLLIIMVIASDGMVIITVQILIKVKEFFHNR